MRDYQPRRPPPPRPPHPERKLSPDSLRFVLWACRATFRAGKEATRAAFVRLLNQTWLEDGEKYERTKVPYNIFEATEGGEGAEIHYWHLEAYGEVVDANSAVLLLISRVRAELEHGKPDDAHDILAGIGALVDGLRSVVSGGRRVEAQDVYELLSIYRSARIAAASARAATPSDEH